VAFSDGFCFSFVCYIKLITFPLLVQVKLYHVVSYRIGSNQPVTRDSIIMH